MAMRAADKAAPLSPGKAIYQLIVEAKAALKADRRGDVRYAFFRPVSIELDDGHVYSAFTREISETGIGLVHNMPLGEGEVEVSVRSDCGYSIRVRTQIIWCVSCGEGWYISGGRFSGIASIGR
jgi:hypothetical protein